MRVSPCRVRSCTLIDSGFVFPTEFNASFLGCPLNRRSTEHVSSMLLNLNACKSPVLLFLLCGLGDTYRQLYNSLHLMPCQHNPTAEIQERTSCVCTFGWRKVVGRQPPNTYTGHMAYIPHQCNRHFLWYRPDNKECTWRWRAVSASKSAPSFGLIVAMVRCISFKRALRR